MSTYLLYTEYTRLRDSLNSNKLLALINPIPPLTTIPCSYGVLTWHRQQGIRPDSRTTCRDSVSSRSYQRTTHTQEHDRQRYRVCRSKKWKIFASLLRQFHIICDHPILQHDKALARLTLSVLTNFNFSLSKLSASTESSETHRAEPCEWHHSRFSL